MVVEVAAGTAAWAIVVVTHTDQGGQAGRGGRHHRLGQPGDSGAR